MDTPFKYGPTAPDTAALVEAAIQALAEVGPRISHDGYMNYDPASTHWQWLPSARAYCALARALGIL